MPFSTKTTFGIWAAILGIVLFLLDMLGHANGWYLQHWHFDKGMHTIGGIFVAFLFALYLVRRGQFVFSSRLMVNIVLFVFCIGILWEAYEYIVQAITGTFLATPIDSLGDIIFDLVGGIIATRLIFFVSKSQKRYNSTNAS
jgi:VanZ family protein